MEGLTLAGLEVNVAARIRLVVGPRVSERLQDRVRDLRIPVARAQRALADVLTPDPVLVFPDQREDRLTLTNLWDLGIRERRKLVDLADPALIRAGVCRRPKIE